MSKSLRVSVASEKSRFGLDVSNSILCSSSGEVVKLHDHLQDKNIKIYVDNNKTVIIN